MATNAHTAAHTEQTSASAALERLAAALDPGTFTTTLTSTPGQPPRLTVTSRHADIGDDIYADHQSYWWSFAERIAAIDNPQAATHKVATVLGTTPQNTPAPTPATARHPSQPVK